MDNDVRLSGAAALALLAAANLLAPPAGALDPERRIAQYKHTGWTRAEGAPSNLVDVDQTPDGFLWLATHDGLFRFDGLSFERIDPQVDTETEGNPLELLVTRGGEVWTVYGQSGRFAVYRGGALRFVPSPPRTGQVIRLAETPDGAIWAGIGNIGQPLLRYHNGRWGRIWPPQSLGLGRDMLLDLKVAPDGAIWLTYVHHILRLGYGARRFEVVLSAPEVRSRMAMDRDGRMWMVAAAQSRPLSGPGGRWPVRDAGPAHPSPGGQYRREAMFDRDGNLWVINQRQGVQRLSLSDPPTAAPRIEDFRARDGLASDVVNDIFEDREGNVWIASAQGLDRFRNANVAVEPMLRRPAAYGDILFTASDGQVYIAQADAVYRVAPHGDPQPILTGTPEPEAICEGPDGTVWIVLADRIVGFAGAGRRTLPRPPQAETGIYECGFDRWNRFWLSAAGSGMYRRTASGWAHIAPAPPGPGFYPTQMAADPAGVLWVLWAEGILARLGARETMVSPIPHVDRLGEIRHIYPSPDGLILTGNRGVARLRDGRIAIARGARIPGLWRANGMVQTPQGETWALGSRGLARMRTVDLDRAFRNPGLVVPTRLFDFNDGLAESSFSQSWRSLVRGGDGRLWAGTMAGTVWIDPARLTSNPIPPGVTVSSVVADGRRYRDPAALRLPAGVSDLVVNFAALSLGIPERVRVLYRLEGHDQGWIDPGTRRQAFYTNLAPGTYRFRVIAANEDGVWNRDGAALDLTLPPTFFQSVWFKLLCALVLGLLAWLLYALRLRQVKARLRSRYDVRIAERERIARELHDTLLQGFQGLTLFFQSVAQRVPPDSDLRPPIERALDRAGTVLVEGRERVRELRSENASNDLAQALRDLAGDIFFAGGPDFRVVVQGEQRPIHALVSEEALRIADEAIRNAARHAGATMVEAVVGYGGQGLRLIVRDDGVGIPEEILRSGERDGHYGLVGMRERAVQIGGRLAVASRAGAGTEVTLWIPARAAYRERRPGLRDRLGLRGRRTA